MKKNYKILLGFIAGAGAGLSIGYLTAPRSGKATRKKISKDLKDTTESLEKNVAEKMTETWSALDQALAKTREEARDGKDKVKGKVKELVEN